MREKIYTYLKQKEYGASSKEIVEHVLKIKGVPQNIDEKLVQTAVAGDNRFAMDEQHLWKIIETGGTPLSDAEFVFLAIFTVERVDRAKIILEISAQKQTDDRITDHFYAVINPGSTAVSSISLPPDLIQELKDGLTLEKAAHLLFHFIGESALVGYNIHSSVNQLNMILNKTNKNIENASLCLKYLTRKLLPELHSKLLNEVASFFKIPIIDNGRSENEVRTIVEIFSRCKELLKGNDVSTLEDILEFQYPDIEYIDFSKYDFDRDFLRSIPQKPGVYKMKDKDGNVIYVGKSKNLKQRLNSYFLNTAERLEKIADLLNHVYAIEYEVTGSELAAMLLEYRLIQQYRPRLNQQVEVHERVTRYGNLKNFIVILPSSMEKSLELFFAKDGLPVQQYEILKEAVNLSEVERILDRDTQGNHILTDIETGEIEIVLTWVEANRDRVNYINMDMVSGKEACLKLIKDYIRDEETPQKKHFRSILY